MLKHIAKAVAYHKAPKATFTMLHPKNAVRLKKAQYDMRYALAPRIAAVGAAVIALPLGFLLAKGASRAGPAARRIRNSLDQHSEALRNRGAGDDAVERASRPAARDRTMVNTPRVRPTGPDAVRT